MFRTTALTRRSLAIAVGQGILGGAVAAVMLGLMHSLQHAIWSSAHQAPALTSSSTPPTSSWPEKRICGTAVAIAAKTTVPAMMRTQGRVIFAASAPIGPRTAM